MTAYTEQNIIAALQEARGANDFVTIFHHLRKAGIDFYDVDFRTKTITYGMGDARHVETLPFAMPTHQGSTFQLQALKNTITDVQQGRINYPAFCQRSFEAGITNYRVDMHAHTVTYQGYGQTHIEPVPHQD